MRRLVALLEKELRHHAAIGMGLLLFLPFAYLIVALGVWATPDRVTFLMAHVVFLWVFLPLAGVVLGNRLVVTEYQGRTQLFIEALPIRRYEMVGLKLLLGLIALEAVAGASLLVTALIATSTEPVGPAMLALMAARGGAYVFCLWSLLFAMGFLGRLRIPLYVAMALTLIAIDSLTELDIWSFGPFELVDQQMALEREGLPAGALITTLALGAAFTALGFVLPLLNEGSVAESLSRRMSLKEKSVAGGLIVAATIAISALEERREKEPFSFQSEAVAAAEAAPIEVLYRTETARADAEALLETIEADLTGLRDALGWAELPPVRVSLWSSLAGDEVETVDLAQNEGVLVRADFRRGPGWDEWGFRSRLIEEVLDARTEDRASFEPYAAFTEGFARFWAGRDRLELCSEAPAGCPLALRALALDARAGPWDRDDLRQWFRFRERHGEAMTRAAAFSLVATLERLRGPEAVMTLARRLYGRDIPQDLRAVIHARRHPFPEVFGEAAGVSWDEFLGQWRSELARSRGLPEVAAALREVPEARGQVTIEREEGAIRTLAYRVWIEGGPPGGDLRFALLHRGLSPFDGPLERDELHQEVHELDGEGAAHRLVGRYGPGSRVFVALELESERLGCPIRLLAQRRVIR